MSDSALIDPAVLKDRFGDRIRIGTDCRISASTVIEIAADGHLVLGDRVTMRRGVTLEVDRQATAVIGDNVDIGENVFIYVMCGVFIGSGVGISNMVDIHDHNHRERAPQFLATGELTTCDSGFAAAPIVVEDGAVISNKASLVAGVRVGANTLVGANSVVSRSLPPNVVAAGAPARPFRSFHAELSERRNPHTIRVGFFGTSIMEHFEAYAEEMFQQWNLPAVGELVKVQSWRRRGYAAGLAHALRVKHAHIRWEFDNHSEGGATSRDILANVAKAAGVPEPRCDVAYIGCGLNDIWRGFQGRDNEAVDIVEYEKNVSDAVAKLKSFSRRVVFLGETPFDLPVYQLPEMNAQVRRYAQVARSVCAAHGVEYLDCYEPFVERAHMMAAYDDAHRPQLWADGVHLSDYGDELMLQLLLSHAEALGLFTDLFEYERVERNEALVRYEALTRQWREAAFSFLEAEPAPTGDNF